MQKVNKITYALAAILAVVVFIFSSFVGGGAAVGYAATSTNSVQMAFERTNVLDDLQKSTVNGEPFNFSEWNFDERKDTQIISFIEFCYSFYSNKQSDYGLYIYVYNPKGINYVYDSGLNAIQLAVSSSVDNDNIDYSKYRLQYLNMSTVAGYEGLFLKYKIVLSDTQKKSILITLNSTERVYKVGEIELLISGEVNPQFYGISCTYKYSGYAVGYGSNAATDDTLSCSTTGLTSIAPNVYHTFYRLSGSNGKNGYTQDTLQSVYFSVPNSLLDEYGELVEVRATWLKTMLQWALVTGDESYYNFVYNLMGYDMSHGQATSGAITKNNDLSTFSDMRIYAKDVTPLSDGFYFDYGQYDPMAKANFGWFSGLYYSGDGENSADTYVVPREDILETMKNYHDDYDTKSRYIYDTTPANPKPNWFYSKYAWSTPYDGEYLTVNGVTYPYSKALFESWDNEMTVADISKSKEYSLSSQVISKTWFEKFLGLGPSNVGSLTTVEGIEAIHEVTKNDIKSTSKLTCDSLYIDTSDYRHFKDFYDKSTTADETVFLLRFDVGEYSALEANLGVTNNSTLVTPNINIKNTNGRIFKQNCYVGFDLIHLKFEGEKGVTTIPVLMSPMTLVSDGTPALITNPDKSLWDLIKLLLAVVGVILIIVLFAPILIPLLSAIVKGLIWFITAPFKAIAKLFKKKE